MKTWTLLFSILLSMFLTPQILNAKTDPYGSFNEKFAALYKPCETPSPRAKYITPNETGGVEQLSRLNLKNCPTYGVLLKKELPGLTPKTLLGQYGERVFRKVTIEHPDTLKLGREPIDHKIAIGTPLALYKWELGQRAIRLFWFTVDPVTPSEKPKRDPVEIGVETDFLLPSDWSYSKNEAEILNWLASWIKPLDHLDRPILAGKSTVDLTASSSAHVLKEGLSIEEVRAMLGKPVDEAIFGDTHTLAYPDKVLTFKNGKLTQVKFR